MLGVGCALGLRLVLASIFVEGVIAAEAAAVAEQQTDGGAASKIESAASAATHQLQRDLRMLTQFNRKCGPAQPVDQTSGGQSSFSVDHAPRIFRPHMALALWLVFLRLRLATCYSSSIRRGLGDEPVRPIGCVEHHSHAIRPS